MRNNIILFRNIFLFTIILLVTSSCYWRIRNPNEVPPQLRVLYLNPQNVESHFKVQLINTLRSVKIALTPTPQAAPYTLNVYDYSMIHDNPAVQSSTIAITYTYTLTVTVSVTDVHGNIVIPSHTIQTTRDVTVNTNQIFSINSTSIFQQEMEREAVNLIYYWLTSSQSHQILNSPARTINATIPPTTTISS